MSGAISASKSWCFLSGKDIGKTGGSGADQQGVHV